MTTRFWSKISAALGIALALSMIVAQPADARRGGSFGSRGSRTYSRPAPTSTAPGYTAPVQRSMTAPGAGGAYAPRPGMPGYAGYQPGYGGYGGGGLFGGRGGSFLGGLVAGGLIGGLLSGGHHWGGGWGGSGWGGGGGGLLTILIQLLILGFVINLVMRMFRRRAGYSAYDAQPAFGGGPAAFSGGFGGGGFGGGPSAAPFVPTSGPSWDIPISAQDQAQFETLLKEVQDCFGREDYAGLRERCTPEVMSYLSEELSENATHGRRNEVTGTRLIQADVGEAWREGDVEYATAAMKYESIDLMRDRTTGAVLSGDPNRPSQATELWTFARHIGGAWKLSAIQETQ